MAAVSRSWRVGGELLLLLGLYLLLEAVRGAGGISSDGAGIMERSTGDGCRRGLQMSGHIHHEGQDVAELKAGMDVCLIEDRHQGECAGVL